MLRDFMDKIATAITVRLAAAPQERDRGSVSLETVMWVLFWIGVATAAGVVIDLAVTGRMAQIK